MELQKLVKSLRDSILMLSLLVPVALLAQVPQDTTSRQLLPVGHDTTQYGYPMNRPIERVGGFEDDISRSFPKEGAIFKKITEPRIAKWKTELYEKTGIKLALSYQIALLHASNVVQGNNTAAAGFFLPEFQWDAINRGKDYQGSLVVSALDVHVYGSAAAPGLFLFNTGSLLAHDAFYIDIDFFVGNLFWEQWFKKDRFVLRVGNISAPNLIDFFRYADFRTSFQEPNLSFPGALMPYGPPGMGASIKWWPVDKSEFYITAIVNDINSNIDDLEANIFSTGDIFFGSEFGYNWKRLGTKGGELDHVHLNVFYGDVPSTRVFAPFAAAGWGFKVAGEKQKGNWVGFANYTYNESSGGGFGFTSLRHALNLGVAYNNPLNIKGEIAAAYSWGKAQDFGQCGVKPCSGQQQSDIEMYWKILVLPDMFVTPGLQMVFNPSLFEGVDTPGLVWVPSLRARVFF